MRHPDGPERTDPGRGVVSLVGAGPGDPGLLTRRAVHRLRTADLVLYDALVPQSLLRLATRARCLPVGKRAGRHSIRQEAINGLLIAAARDGKRVVRLKGGDPFVFGRGGEEALALRAAGVRVEVVPGVSAAFSAPALAGIPVTHRGSSTAVVVVSGHAHEAYAPVLAALPPTGVTVVALMGLASRADLTATLLSAGWSAEVPAAIVLAAGTRGQVEWYGALGDLPGAPIADGDDAPGTIVIGEVVRVGATLGRIGRPVAGRTTARRRIRVRAS